jgi:D-glycero-D-manno-heptose 1,7-bisphosphate phosphatase
MSRFKAAFLDRDGTLNKEVEYLHRIEDFEWIPSAPQAIRRLNEAGILVLVVTNQAGVARGYYSEQDVGALHDHMRRELAKEGAHIDAFYYCPHHPDGTVAEYRRDSHRRKPATGMFEQGLGEWGLQAKDCVVVGDKNIDMKPGEMLGMTTILVQTGYGEVETETTEADHVTSDVATATDLILTL